MRSGARVRIVLDTNVLISAVLSQQGPSHALWDHVLNARLELFVTQALLDEFADVVSRDKFAAVLARTTRTSQMLLLKLRESAELVASVPLPAPVSRDPDDDSVTTAAVAAQAAWIVTGDRDLPVLGSYEGIASEHEPTHNPACRGSGHVLPGRA